MVATRGSGAKSMAWHFPWCFWDTLSASDFQKSIAWVFEALCDAYSILGIGVPQSPTADDLATGHRGETTGWVPIHHNLLEDGPRTRNESGKRGMYVRARRREFRYMHTLIHLRAQILHYLCARRCRL
jgi:hypothetical protein